MTVTTLDRWAPEEAEMPLDRARGGSQEAFAEIVEQYQSMVYSICLRGVRERHLAEELAQEVFLQLYRDLDGIESDRHLMNWLRRAAAHRVIDIYRTQRPSVSLELVREPESEGRLSDPLLRDRLRELVAELPVNQRMTVILRFGEDMKLSEIAETLDAPINTVKSNLRRALMRLKERLTPEGERT